MSSYQTKVSRKSYILAPLAYSIAYWFQRIPARSVYDSSFGLFQVRHCQVRHLSDRSHIELPGLVEDIHEVRVPNGGRLMNARIVDEDIDSAEGFDRLVYQVLSAFLFGQVYRHLQRLTTNVNLGLRLECSTFLPDTSSTSLAALATLSWLDPVTTTLAPK